MQYSAILLALATGSLAASYEYLPKNGTAYETVTLTAITTYCPYPTEVVHNSKTYTVTEATTLTITDCPCTITKVSLLPSSLLLQCIDRYLADRAPSRLDSSVHLLPTRGFVQVAGSSPRAPEVYWPSLQQPTDSGISKCH